MGALSSPNSKSAVLGIAGFLATLVLLFLQKAPFQRVILALAIGFCLWSASFSFFSLQNHFNNSAALQSKTRQFFILTILLTIILSAPLFVFMRVGKAWEISAILLGIVSLIVGYYLESKNS